MPQCSLASERTDQVRRTAWFLRRGCAFVRAIASFLRGLTSFREIGRKVGNDGRAEVYRASASPVCRQTRVRKGGTGAASFGFVENRGVGDVRHLQSSHLRAE